MGWGAGQIGGERLPFMQAGRKEAALVGNLFRPMEAAIGVFRQWELAKTGTRLT